MSQQILSYINQINLRLDQLEKANEALAARVTELERQPSSDGSPPSAKSRLTLPPAKAAGNGPG